MSGGDPSPSANSENFLGGKIFFAPQNGSLICFFRPKNQGGSLCWWGQCWSMVDLMVTWNGMEFGRGSNNMGVEPKIGVFTPPKSSHLFIGLEPLIFIIHFGVPLFLETPKMFFRPKNHWKTMENH